MIYAEQMEGGRPWQDKRNVLEGISWVVTTGSPCKDFPEPYPLTKLIKAIPDELKGGLPAIEDFENELKDL
jgi:hypothetical protein